MRTSPSIAPHGPEQDTYLVLDDYGGRLGFAWRETDQDRADREALIRDLVEGEFSNPVRIVCFNTAEGWSRDVSRADATPSWAKSRSRCWSSWRPTGAECRCHRVATIAR
jgi:hypothetical protein